MISMEKELTNLTKAQVEALLECFDFLANGYLETACFEVGDLWLIEMIHRRKFRSIRVFIHPDRYRIQVAGYTRKKVSFESTPDRYRIIVNSDASVGVVKLQACASKL